MILWVFLSSVVSRHFGPVSGCKWQVLILQRFLTNFQFNSRSREFTRAVRPFWVLILRRVSHYWFPHSSNIKLLFWVPASQSEKVSPCDDTLRCAEVSGHTHTQKFSLRLKLIIWEKFYFIFKSVLLLEPFMLTFYLLQFQLDTFSILDQNKPEIVETARRKIKSNAWISANDGQKRLLLLYLQPVTGGSSRQARRSLRTW